MSAFTNAPCEASTFVEPRDLPLDSADTLIDFMNLVGDSPG